jgi:phosphoribosylglycinamide formyltransferase 1
MKPKLAVIVSGTARTLRNLLEHEKDGSLDAEIVLVITTKHDSNGSEYAKAFGIPCVEISRKAYLSDSSWSHEVTNTLYKNKVEFVALAGCIHRYVVPQEYQWKVVNIHPSLLPSFGGKGWYGNRVHEEVIKQGQTKTGCTVHFANSEYDAGPIIAQESVDVSQDDDAETIAEKVFELEKQLFPKTINRLVNGEL